MNSELLVFWSRVKSYLKKKAKQQQKPQMISSLGRLRQEGPVLALLGYSMEFKTGLVIESLYHKRLPQAQAVMLGFWSLLSPDQ